MQRCFVFLLLIVLGVSGIAHSGNRVAGIHACRPGSDRDEPATPLRLSGKVGHGGTCGISSVLVTSDRGPFVVDGATARPACRSGKIDEDAG